MPRTPWTSPAGRHGWRAQRERKNRRNTIESIAVALFAVLLRVQSPVISVTPAHLHPGSPFILTMRGLAAGRRYDIEFDDRTLGFTGGGDVAVLLGVDLGHPEGT
ncbi:MAG: hypothetical protein M1517_10330, partial [Deltaproteobacteria bacterium]|nr:hypothetical protein [Deltaproteobacteria bacterium]